MVKTVFKRKIYDEILEWKEKRSDKYALLIKGARRVGKSIISLTIYQLYIIMKQSIFIIHRNRRMPVEWSTIPSNR